MGPNFSWQLILSEMVFLLFHRSALCQSKKFYVEKFGFQQNKTNHNEKIEIRSKSVKQKAAFKKTNNQCQSVIGQYI